LIAKNEAYSGRSMSRSTSASRFAGPASATNAFTSAAVGKVPVMSSDARRMNSASVHGSEGTIPSAFHCFSAAASIRLAGGKSGYVAIGTPSGTNARKTATCPWYRAITAARPAIPRVST
jgi:hypothetical protein